jgi:hypothetical protein
MRGEAEGETRKADGPYDDRNRWLWLELYILSRTVTAVVMGRGAV